jgi:hypothetical protein
MNMHKNDTPGTLGFNDNMVREHAPFTHQRPKMNLHSLAADLADRVPAMALDSKLNNSVLLERLLVEAGCMVNGCEHVSLLATKFPGLFRCVDCEQLTTA